MRSHRARFNEAREHALRAAFALSVMAIVGTAGSGVVRAQPTFPAKPIHISIPYGAGGVADLTMRLLAQKLTGEQVSRVAYQKAR
jgi:putative tricarboxylic transport membrane protein